MKKVFWVLAVLLSATYFSSCTCHKKQSMEMDQDAQNESGERRPSQFEPNDYQAQQPDPQHAPDYQGISVEQVISFDLKKGSGPQLQLADQVQMTYSLWVYDPKRIGNKGLMILENETIQITVGKNQTLVGLEQGIQGMAQGGQRSLIIPIKDAFGPKGNSKVPPGAIILAEVSVLKITKAK